MDRADGGGCTLSGDEVVVLATPIFGAPLTAEQIARIERVPNVRVVAMSGDGLVHDDAEASLAAARVLLRGGIAGHRPGPRPGTNAAPGVDPLLLGRRRPGRHPAVRARELTVTNARGVFSRPIAEYVVMMCLAIARRMPQLLELQRERTWQPLRGRELGGLTVGHRRLRQHRLGDRASARAVRLDRPRHPAPSGARQRRRGRTWS